MHSSCRVFVLAVVALLLSLGAWAQDTPVYFAPDPGVATGEVRPDGFALSNAAVSVNGRISGGHLESLAFQNRMVGGIEQVRLLPFALLLGDASVIPASGMKIVSAPKIVELAVQPDASRLAERVPGKAVVIELEDASGRLDVT